MIFDNLYAAFVKSGSSAHKHQGILICSCQQSAFNSQMENVLSTADIVFVMIINDVDPISLTVVYMHQIRNLPIRTMFYWFIFCRTEE